MLKSEVLVASTSAKALAPSAPRLLSRTLRSEVQTHKHISQRATLTLATDAYVEQQPADVASEQTREASVGECCIGC